MYRQWGLQFQFTRPRGARLISKDRIVLVISFNSRAREGRDPSTISKMRLMPSRFNSRAREGRDAMYSRVKDEGNQFQFTRPRGARLDPSETMMIDARGFNSRAREGRDWIALYHGLG